MLKSISEEQKKNIQATQMLHSNPHHQYSSGSFLIHTCWLQFMQRSLLKSKNLIHISFLLQCILSNKNTTGKSVCPNTVFPPINIDAFLFLNPSLRIFLCKAPLLIECLWVTSLVLDKHCRIPKQTVFTRKKKILCGRGVFLLYQKQT